MAKSVGHSCDTPVLASEMTSAFVLLELLAYLLLDLLVYVILDYIPGAGTWKGLLR